MPHDIGRTWGALPAGPAMKKAAPRRLAAAPPSARRLPRSDGRVGRGWSMPIFPPLQAARRAVRGGWVTIRAGLSATQDSARSPRRAPPRAGEGCLGYDPSKCRHLMGEVSEVSVALITRLRTRKLVVVGCLIAP